jgi:hypothetical protein
VRTVVFVVEKKKTENFMRGIWRVAILGYEFLQNCAAV